MMMVLMCMNAFQPYFDHEIGTICDVCESKRDAGKRKNFTVSINQFVFVTFRP
jgi:hypothetical protein